MSAKYKKLIMVAVGGKGAAQSNKYYTMDYSGSGSTFTVKYGRVESTETVLQKSISEWDSIYRSKVAKGYKDVTDFVSVVEEDTKKQAATPTTLTDTGDVKVDEFLKLMQAYTSNLVSTTYSVKAVNVSQKQVDAAQAHIDTISKLSKAKKLDEAAINEALMELYVTIPRRMSDVRQNILPNITLDKVLQQEQDNLDAMASQVKQLEDEKEAASVKKDVKKIKKETKTVLDVLGIENMKHVDASDKQVQKDIGYLLSQNYGGRASKIEAIYSLNKPLEDKNIKEWMATRKDQTTKILIHGTRCASVLPILQTSLQIRPAGNFQFSGKAYGDGNYFSETMVKSLGYTGYDKDIVILVYEVHTGNPFTYSGWYNGNSFPLTLKELTSRGFDSTFVSAGNGLLNSEIIAYSEKQNRLKYLIWLKR